MSDPEAIGRSLQELVAQAALRDDEARQAAGVDPERLHTELLCLRVHVAEAAVRAAFDAGRSALVLKDFHTELDRRFAGRIAGGEDALFSALLHDRLVAYAAAVAGDAEHETLGRELARLLGHPDDAGLAALGADEARAFAGLCQERLRDMS